ncbi:MAG: hypothetical protein NXH85_18585 [Pseudomonadaceae bacterium]|nr:hypothetical protein [Pseudomonadaceae bacterium]
MATAKQAAAHIDISERRFRQLRQQGAVTGPKGGKGGYDLDEVRLQYIRALRASKGDLAGVTQSGVADDIAAEKLKKLRIENARLTRELVPVDVLELYARKLGSTVKDGLDALVGNVKKRLPHLRSSELQMIRQEIAKTSNAIADFNPDHERAI